MSNKELEKYKRLIKNAGISAAVMGWVTIFLNIGIYLWSVFDKSFAASGLSRPNLTGTFIIVIVAIVFIILGNRIKSLTDPNIKKYLQVLLILSLAILVFVFATGGQAGFLFLLVFCYITCALLSVNKLMKAEEFSSTLRAPDYKIKKKGWIMLAIVGLIVLMGTIFIDSSLYSLPEKESEKKVIDYFANQNEWREFNSATGRFRALFPAYPVHKTNNLRLLGVGSPVKQDSYSIKTADAFYAIYVATYPPEVDTSNPETNLKSSLNGMLSVEGNELISSNFTNFGDYRAVDFLIKNVDRNAYLKGRIIVIGQTLYQLLVAYKNGSYNDSDYTRFINSFHLIK